MIVVPSAGEGALFRLMYRSRSLLAPATSAVDLGTLFSEARAHNKSLGVTGALLLDGSSFVQVLEGEEEVVQGLYAAISADARHDAVELLTAGPADDRVFARWSMARVSADGDPDIPLIAHVDGIAPAAPRATTTAQDGLLDAMRRAAHPVSSR